jgi:hypothetical protein
LACQFDPMNVSKNVVLFALAIMIFAGCKGKKKPSLSGEDPVEISDFIDFFPSINLPYNVTDSTLNKKENDSTFISQRVFSQFIPDSFMTRAFGANAKTNIYPVGKNEGPGGETYIFVKAMSGNKKSAFVFAFDKNEELIDGMLLLLPDHNPITRQSAVVDKSYSINKIVTRKNSDGTTAEGKDVYGLSGGKFSLIMTDALDENLTELINPIDTLSRKFKYAADYISGKMNLVSIRDGRKKDRLSFFMHFDKNNGECTGEIKGEALIRSATVAEYREGSELGCVLRFTFNNSSVSVKEIGGCGSHRGLRCSFDGTFPRKKEVKPKPIKKKATNS